MGMFQFLSNKQRNIIENNEDTSYNKRSILVILDMNCIHISVAEDSFVFDGRLYDKRDGLMSFLSYDGTSIIGLSIVAGKISSISFHLLRGEEIYSSTVYEQTVDFSTVHSLVYECQNQDKKRTIAAIRDRGRKKTILTLPWYSPYRINTLFSENYWGQIGNYYITWLKFYCLGNDDNISELSRVLYDFSDRNILDRVLLNDRSHCLGAALCLSELLDRLVVYSTRLNLQSAINPVLKYALLSVLVYLATYKGQDPLMDSQLYAILGRMCDICNEEIVGIALANGITNPALVDDLYVFSMYSASQSAQDVWTKTEYFRNALMMHQNQTVIGVTEDHMDESYIDSVNLGKSTFNTLVVSMSESLRTGNCVLSSKEKEDVENAVELINPSNFDSQELSNVKALCLIYSFDCSHSDFPTVEFVKNSLDSFYKQIGLKDIPRETRKEDGSYFVQIHNRKDCTIEPDILWLNITFDEDRMISGIGIRCFLHGYEIKKNIDRTNMFHGFVCQVSMYEFSTSPQEIILLPFLANEYI